MRRTDLWQLLGTPFGRRSSEIALSLPCRADCSIVLCTLRSDKPKLRLRHGASIDVTEERKDTESSVDGSSYRTSLPSMTGSCSSNIVFGLRLGSTTAFVVIALLIDVTKSPAVRLTSNSSFLPRRAITGSDQRTEGWREDARPEDCGGPVERFVAWRLEHEVRHQHHLRHDSERWHQEGDCHEDEGHGVHCETRSGRTHEPTGDGYRFERGSPPATWKDTGLGSGDEARGCTVTRMMFVRTASCGPWNRFQVDGKPFRVKYVLKFPAGESEVWATLVPETKEAPPSEPVSVRSHFRNNPSCAG